MSGEKDRSRPFLSIQVYVVGLYIAVPDIATLQERLTRVLDPVATTLVPGERSQLKNILLDPERGEEVWNQILRDGNLRTAIKIVPTRNTDLQHLRDGFIRGITARAKHLEGLGDGKAEMFSDDAFGAAVAQFKAIWGKTTEMALMVPKVKALSKIALRKSTSFSLSPVESVSPITLIPL
jgi:hypothetical protein